MNPGDCWPDHDDIEPVLVKEEQAEGKRELADLNVLAGTVLATTTKPEPRFVPPRLGYAQTTSGPLAAQNPLAAKIAALQDRAGAPVAQRKPVPGEPVAKPKPA